MNINEFFRRFAARTGEATASPWAFLIAVSVVVVWGITGPFFDFSDTWQLTINTTASIVPSLMVFLLQNTQSRDTKEIQLKLDELIRAVGGTRPYLISLQDLPDEELGKLQAEFQRLKERMKPDAQPADDAGFER